jgi:hypothetical protein
MIEKNYWNRICLHQEISIIEMMELIADFREEAKLAGKEMSVQIMDELYAKCNSALLYNTILSVYSESRHFLPTSAPSIERSSEIQQ